MDKFKQRTFTFTALSRLQQIFIENWSVAVLSTLNMNKSTKPMMQKIECLKRVLNYCFCTDRHIFAHFVKFLLLEKMSKMSERKLLSISEYKIKVKM